jgi:thioredoxin reductase
LDELYKLAIVGAGLCTLSALQAGLGRERTLLLDYQDRAGGFLRPALPSSTFADQTQLVQRDTLPAHVTAWFNSTAVGLLPAYEEGEPHTLLVRRRSGTTEVRAEQVLLACGGLELTREHAQIPGPRPAGVVTPIFVHQLLNRGYAPGRQIVVYGDSRYTLATAQRLAEVGLAVTLIGVPGASEPELASASVFSSSLTILPPAQLVSLSGFPRLAQLTFERAGEQFTLSADTLVYGAGMQANTHWLKGSGLALTEQGAISVDARYATSAPGIYAMGTVVFPSLDHVHSIDMGKEVASLLSGGSQ